MRVALEQPALVGDLIVYLHRCDCPARRLREDLIDVDERALALDEALALVRAGRCYGCSGIVTEALAELGSPLCDDCRDGVVRPRPDLRSSRLKVEALLRVWNVLHPEARVSVADVA